MGNVKLAPWPHYADDEVAAVKDVLRSGVVNYRGGVHGPKFESEYAAACGTAHGLAVANGTVALELALQAAGIGAGDDVIVPARTFIATAAAAVRVGATPVVADIDRRSHNLTAETVEAVLTPKTRAVIAVHLGGWPADMDSLRALAQAKNLRLIEDCAQAHGALYKGRAVGGLGDAGCFSFCRDKIISTGGEGGMIATGDAALYQRAWSLREHGWDYEKAHTDDPNDGFRWLVSDFGTNARLTESQAAIGRLQLAKLEQWVARRGAHAAQLDRSLADVSGLSLLTPDSNIRHAYYRYAFLIDPVALKTGWTRNRVLNEIDARGVPARVGGCPDLSQEQAFRKIAMPQALPNAAWVGERSAVLPVHPTLTEGHIALMADTVRAVMKQAVR